MLELQNTVLEMIAKGETLKDTALRLCVEAEKLCPGTICSILTVDRAGTVHPLAGPSLPQHYSDAIEGVKIGPLSGSCGTAAYLGEPVAATDISTDPRWKYFKVLALPLGLKACWSSPIFGADGTVVGTFAFYFPECRGPTALEEEIVDKCVHLCTIAMERHVQLIEHERRAYEDALTGLENRAAYNVALGGLDCSRAGSWALLLLDLDNLKVVNDTFGHHTGDVLIREVGERLARAVSPDHVYRIGGDEFAIIVQAEDALEDLEKSANELLAVIAPPANCNGHVIAPRATIGAAHFAEGDGVAERVRQNADFALYHAKETGRGGFVRYWPGIGSKMTKRLTAIREVDAALQDNRIMAYYQPVVVLDTREIVGLEALSRMRIGEETKSAAAFHEATTDVHVATELTRRMTELVAGDLRHWLDLGLALPHVGINVSSADIHGGAIERVLMEAFDRESVPLDKVTLEVTESVYMDDDGGTVQRAITALRNRGLRVALDDFGTGYASLTHLMTVPVDTIKIDKSFVESIERNDPSYIIVEGLVGIANRMGISVIAEGIETEQQAAHLRALGCQYGQGYLFSHAVDSQTMTAMLACGNPFDRGSSAPAHSSVTSVGR